MKGGNGGLFTNKTSPKQPFHVKGSGVEFKSRGIKSSSGQFFAYVCPFILESMRPRLSLGNIWASPRCLHFTQACRSSLLWHVSAGLPLQTCRSINKGFFSSPAQELFWVSCGFSLSETLPVSLCRSFLSACRASYSFCNTMVWQNHAGKKAVPSEHVAYIIITWGLQLQINIWNASTYHLSQEIQSTPQSWVLC